MSFNHAFPLRLSSKVPAERSQHAKNNISQHYWTQHVACVWPPCCDVLRHVGCCWFKFENGQIWANNTQHAATWWPNAWRQYNVAICCLGVLRSFGRDFKLKWPILPWTSLTDIREVTRSSLCVCYSVTSSPRFVIRFMSIVTALGYGFSKLCFEPYPAPCVTRWVPVKLR